jgi:hypothetical protein
VTIGHPSAVADALAMSIQSLHGHNFSFHSTSARMALGTMEMVAG